MKGWPSVELVVAVVAGAAVHRLWGWPGTLACAFGIVLGFWVFWRAVR